MTSAASSGLSVRRSTYPVIAAWFAAYICSNLRRRACAALVSDVRTAAPLDTRYMSAEDESISRSTLENEGKQLSTRRWRRRSGSASRERFPYLAVLGVP